MASLFRTITIQARNEEAAAAPEEEMKAASAPNGKEDALDGSESDLVSEEEEELESDSQTDCSDEEEDEQEDNMIPVNRTASIARQVVFDAFITKIIEENNWSRATNWKDRELSYLSNIIEVASLKHNIKHTTADLKS